MTSKLAIYVRYELGLFRILRVTLPKIFQILLGKNAKRPPELWGSGHTSPEFLF